MPEIHFQIRWCDGSEDTCYSPSLIVQKYFTPDTDYPLADFLERSRIALNIASDRVKEKYGFPCGRALGQLQRIEAMAAQYRDLPEPTVRVIRFIE